MKAIGALQAHPISHEESLFEFEADKPVPGPRDLLIKVRAVSVNPVDTKVRSRIDGQLETPRILGWDAVGQIEAVGDAVEHFKPGDDVFYAGAINRDGSNAEYQLVDERLVGHKPASLTDAEAAALPLTTITAWEILFHRFGLTAENSKGKSLLVVGGAGGVGSIMIQLARQLTDLTVIATASRDETRNWVEKMGAHHAIDHRKPLGEELTRVGMPQVDYIATLTATETHLPTYPEIIAPQGHIAVIDDPDSLNIMPFKLKSITVHWELMFTRSLFQTDDMDKQRQLLNEASRLLNDGKLKSTLAETLSPIDAATLKTAHEKVESGSMVGKLVVEGW